MRKCLADRLSKQNTDCLEGIFAVIVLIHHLHQHSQMVQGWLAIGFQLLGFLSVAVFFFLSGYGLQLSYNKKGDVYIRHFPRQRLAPYYLIIISLIIIYSMFKLLLNGAIDLSLLIKSFFFSDTVISNGWYLQVQLMFYVAFFLIWRLIKDDTGKLGFLFGFVCLYIVLCIVFDVSSTRYNSVLPFALGIFAANSIEKIDDLLSSRKNSIIFCSLSFLAFFLLFGLYYIFDGVMKYIVQIFVAVFFVCVVFSFIQFIPINNVLTRFLGKISLEIYVLQGLFLNLFHSSFIYVDNKYLYVALVTLCTILTAVAVSPLYKKTYSIFKLKE